MAKKVSDILGTGLLLVGIFIFIISLRESGLLMLIGITGGVILTILEIWFLIELFTKKNDKL